MGRDTLQSWLRSVTEAKAYQGVLLRHQKTNAARYFHMAGTPTLLSRPELLA
jgi:hypothetical protein